MGNRTKARGKTYTDENLQNAVQAISTGRMGTRRAAVKFGIPRSTLRNKIYRLSDSKRTPTNDDDKDLSGDDDRNSLTPENMTRSQDMEAANLSKYGQMYVNNGQSKGVDMAMQPAPPRTQTSTPNTPQTPPIAALPFDANLLQMLFASQIMQSPNDQSAHLLRLLIQSQEFMKNVAPVANEHMNNGKSAATDARSMLQNLSFLQQPQPHLQNRPMKSDASDVGGDPNDSGDSAVILKVPSYRASAGKNGDSASDVTPQTTPPQHSRSPQTHMTPGISSPIMRSGNDSQSPPMNMRELMRNSITRSFNQQNAEAHSKSSGNSMDQYKPSISVIKNLGGTDMSRFGASPNLMASMAANNANNANNAAGKGTRPKRGKYRNYDRDSLVEAVKAVQRGEMSVHRAGSYYGVPHSTLEYKVKERHLMRPRKREPKPQPLDSGSTSTGSNMKSSHDISRTIDKSKAALSTAKQPMKTPPFPATSPNGMKVNIFDAASAAQLPYAAQMLWPHAPGLPGLPMDYARSDPLFTSVMFQRMQEDARRQSSGNNGSSQSAAATSAAGMANNNSQTKTTRELAESLYDGTNANGAFLDGIIRHSLIDRKPSEALTHGALLDQLVKNNRHAMNDSGSGGVGGSGAVADGSHSRNKRHGSPFQYNQHGIKRERNSSSSCETDRDSVERDLSKESVAAMISYRDGLSLRLDTKKLRHSTDDINGSTSPDHKLSSHQTETEDSS